MITRLTNTATTASEPEPYFGRAGRNAEPCETLEQINDDSCRETVLVNREVARKRRVLSLGHCSSAFVVPLYREISRKLNDVTFDVLNFMPVGSNVRFGEEEVFEHFYQLPSANLGFETLMAFGRVTVQRS